MRDLRFTRQKFNTSRIRGGFQGPRNAIGKEERDAGGEKEDNGLTAFGQV